MLEFVSRAGRQYLSLPVYLCRETRQGQARTSPEVRMDAKGRLDRAFGYQGNTMNLPVRDLPSALPFYATVLGFQVEVDERCPQKSAVSSATRSESDSSRTAVIPHRTVVHSTSPDWKRWPQSSSRTVSRRVRISAPRCATAHPGRCSSRRARRPVLLVRRAPGLYPHMSRRLGYLAAVNLEASSPPSKIYGRPATDAAGRRLLSDQQNGRRGDQLPVYQALQCSFWSLCGTMAMPFAFATPTEMDAAHGELTQCVVGQRRK